MPDFGDDFGDSLKRFSSMFLRELFHQWLRDSQKNRYYHETIGGEDFDVKLFDDDTQRDPQKHENYIYMVDKHNPACHHTEYFDVLDYYHIKKEG